MVAKRSMKMLMGRADSKMAIAFAEAPAMSGRKMSVSTPGRNMNSTPISSE